MLFHMSKKEVVYYAQCPSMSYPISMSWKQVFCFWQVKTSLLFKTFFMLCCPRKKKLKKKIKICLAYVTPRLPTSVHRKIQPIRSSRLPAQREQKHIYEWFVLLFRFKKYKTLWAWVYAYKILQNTKKDNIIFIFFPWYSIIKIIILLGLICVSLKGK